MPRWGFATICAGLILSNCAWSTLGSYYWLQPGGVKPPGFEFIWRLSAQCQVGLFYFAYLIGLGLVRIGNYSPFVTRHETLLSRVGLCHAVLFGLACLSSGACQQSEYVLWGGVNIMLPLVSCQPLHLSQPYGACRVRALPFSTTRASRPLAPLPATLDRTLTTSSRAVPALSMRS